MNAPLPGRARVIALAAGFREAALLQQALEHGIFAACVRARSVAEIARPRRWQQRKTRIVLDALVALGLLDRAGERYSASEVTRRHLVEGTPEYVGDMVLHERLQQGLWSDLTRVLASRSAVEGQQELTTTRDPRAASVLVKAMACIDRQLVDEVAELPIWRTRRSVLDLAGGHGRFLAAIATRNPLLRGAVVDQPLTREVAEATFAAQGLAERLAFRARDLRAHDPLSGLSADGILLARCLHNFAPEVIEHILSRAAAALGRGGALVILERTFDDVTLEPAENAVFGAYMAVNCEGGWLPDGRWLSGLLSNLFDAIDARAAGPRHTLWVASKS